MQLNKEIIKKMRLRLNVFKSIVEENDPMSMQS